MPAIYNFTSYWTEGKVLIGLDLRIFIFIYFMFAAIRIPVMWSYIISLHSDAGILFITRDRIEERIKFVLFVRFLHAIPGLCSSIIQSYLSCLTTPSPTPTLQIIMFSPVQPWKVVYCKSLFSFTFCIFWCKAC